MAYGSDFRVKYLMREIQREVTKKMKKEGLENPLLLRVFDESDDDSGMWAEGGLTFHTPSGDKTGANDAAWYTKKKWVDPDDPEKNTSNATPVLVVEGTFGTETGNVGDAQKTKVGHVADLAGKGIIGAIVMPKVSEYFRHDKKKKKPLPTWINKGRWFSEIVIAALIRTQEYRKSGGCYLIIDAYDKELLIDFVYTLAKDNLKYKKEQAEEKRIVNINLIEQINKIICEMETRGSLKKYLANAAKIDPVQNGTVLKLKMSDGKFSDKHAAKIHTHDAKAFGQVQDSKKSGTFRNGHILRGNVQDVQLITKRKTYLILPRMNKEDYENIDNSGDKKEWNAIVNDKKLGVITLDDIDFGSNEQNLKKNFQRIREKYVNKDVSLSKKDSSDMSDCCKRLKVELVKGNISLKGK